MIRGLIGKTVREVWLATLIFAAGMFAFEAVLAWVLMEFHEDLAGQWLQIDFIQKMFKGLVGAEIGDGFNFSHLGVVAWVHPVILALLWSQAITFCTRVPAGEIDRGTIDVLLGLPVSRWRVYLCESFVGSICGGLMVAAGLAGFLVGSMTIPADSRLDAGHMVVVAVNCGCLCAAVGGLSFLISSVSERRGRAVAVVVGIVMASFLLNFLAQFSEPARQASFLSMMTYYKPLLILRDAAWPVRDMVVLAMMGLATWLAGGVLFSRRDICTT
ncbi:MAG TPA: ABC transporter permease subunit [Phycisphaerae bacterium]|nr:ABC transporter permease subunit [Phycisphaerae bacterium]